MIVLVRMGYVGGAALIDSMCLLCLCVRVGCGCDCVEL